MGDSRQSVQVLQSQLDEFKDRSRRELLEAQRLGKDRLTELQRSQALLKTTQDEVSSRLTLSNSVKDQLTVLINTRL